MKRQGTKSTTETLRATIEGQGHSTFVTLIGAIDENADLTGLFARLAGDTIFDMQGVERVNSMGVHRWIPLVTQFSIDNRMMVEHISYALVQNANVVANLFGSARVRSCMAPYYCAKCKLNVTMSVSQEEVAASPNAPPLKRCGRCSSQLEFDELDSYFTFFKARPRR